MNDKKKVGDKSTLKRILIMDNFRYTNSEVLVGLIKCYLKYPTLLYMRLWRKANYFSKKTGLLDKIKMWFYRGLLHHEMIRLQIQIPYNIEMGEGICIQHIGRVIIAPEVSIGSNCDIFTGVTIGKEFRGKRNGVPRIGNDVWIGPNVVIVGKISIGDDVLIAPNSYVNFNVPDHSIVIGNPATIIHREYATEDYLKYKVYTK